MVTDDLLGATRPRRPWRTDLDDLVTWLRDADGSLVTRGDTTDTGVTGLSLSSQRIVPGDVYAALPGARVHGIDFAAAALAAGAVATGAGGSAAMAAASAAPSAGMMPRWTAAAFCPGPSVGRRRRNGSNPWLDPGSMAAIACRAASTSPPQATKSRRGLYSCSLRLAFIRCILPLRL